MSRRKTTGRARVPHRSIGVVALAAAGLAGIAAPASAAPLLPRPAAIEGAAGSSWQQPVTVKATFRSARLGASAPSTARVLLIGGKPGSSLRYRLGTLQVPALERGELQQLTTTLTPPQRLRAASYRLAICVGRYPKTRCRTSTAITLRVPPTTLSEPVTTPTPSPTPSPTPTASPAPTATPTPVPQGKLAASTTDLAFGVVQSPAVAALAPRYERTVTLSNTGGAALPEVSFALGALTGKPFVLVATNCQTGGLAPGQSCTLRLRTSPTVGETATASRTATAGSESVTIDLSATGAAGPALAVVGKPKFGYELGDVFAGESATQTLTIRNDGDMPEEALAFKVSSPKANAFSITADTCSGKVLAPGDTCTADVKLTVDPGQSSPATFGASVTVGGTWQPDADTATFGVTIHGPRTAPQLSLDAATLKTADAVDFGRYTDLAAVTPSTYTITNLGTERSAPLKLNVPQAFKATSASTCAGARLGDGESCLLVLAPNTDGWRDISAQALVYQTTTLDPNTTIGLRAKARVGTAPKLELVKGSPDWGPTTFGKVVPKVLTFKNTGGGRYFLSGWSLSGDLATFNVTTSTCFDGVAPGGLCTVTLSARFFGLSPTSASVTLEADAAELPGLDLTLRGTGTAGSIAAAFTPASWTFFSPGSKRIDVSFAGSPVNAHNVKITQKPAGREPVTLDITEDTCTGNDFTAAQTCSFLVTFAGQASYADVAITVEADGAPVVTMPITIANS